MAKIYVASSWKNPYQPEVVKRLREQGHQVFDFRNPPDGKGGFFWRDVDPNWEQWSTRDYISHPDDEFTGVIMTCFAINLQRKQKIGSMSKK